MSSTARRERGASTPPGESPPRACTARSGFNRGFALALSARRCVLCVEYVFPGKFEGLLGTRGEIVAAIVWNGG